MPLIPPRTAVLDTCILAKSTPRGILFEAANRGLFQPFWSERTMDELRQFYIHVKKKPPARAGAYVDQVRNLFPEAMVRSRPVQDAPLARDPGDQHVVEAALATKAAYLVTDNLADFPLEALARRNVRVLCCDDFLMQLMQENGEEMVAILSFFADYTLVPPENVLTVIDRLKRSGLPIFAESLRRRLV